MAKGMTRLLAALLLLLSTAALSGCGIKGDLDRPPPLWGDATAGDVPEETQTAESLDADDPFADDDEDDLGYGIDVVD